jgi:hypothetical protein
MMFAVAERARLRGGKLWLIYLFSEIREISRKSATFQSQMLDV